MSERDSREIKLTEKQVASRLPVVVGKAFPWYVEGIDRLSMGYYLKGLIHVNTQIEMDAVKERFQNWKDVFGVLKWDGKKTEKVFGDYIRDILSGYITSRTQEFEDSSLPMVFIQADSINTREFNELTGRLLSNGFHIVQTLEGPSSGYNLHGLFAR